MGEDENDKLDETDAIPEEIASEAYYPMGFGRERAPSDDSNRADIGDADTDRVDISQRVLPAAGRVPQQLTFRVRRILSMNARCFFCKEVECDLVFMARSLSPGKTRAYAVHSSCAFDHTQLEAT